MATEKCFKCDTGDHWQLHYLKHRSEFRQFCPSCVMKISPSLFCPICYVVYDNTHTRSVPGPSTRPGPIKPGPGNDKIICNRCSAVAHAQCLRDVGHVEAGPYGGAGVGVSARPGSGSVAAAVGGGRNRSGRSGWVCPTCMDSKFEYFVEELDETGSLVVNAKNVKKLICVSKLAALSMCKAVVIAGAEVERKNKEAALARKKAREAMLVASEMPGYGKKGKYFVNGFGIGDTESSNVGDLGYLRRSSNGVRGGGQMSMSEVVGDSGQIEDIVKPVVNGGSSSRTGVLPRDAAKRGMSEVVGDSGAVKKLGENGIRSVGNASSGLGILSTAAKASSEVVNDPGVAKKEVGNSMRSLASGVGMLNLSKVGSSEKVFEHQSKKIKGSGNGHAAAGVAVLVPKVTGSHFRPVVLPVNNASKGNNNVATAAAFKVAAPPKQGENKIRPVMLPLVNVGKETGDAVSPVMTLKKIGNIVKSSGNSTSGCTVLPSANAVKGSGAVATASGAVPKQIVNIRPVVNPASGSSVLPSTNVGKGSGAVAASASAVAPKLVENSVRSVSNTPKCSSGSGVNVDKSNASSVTGHQQLQDSAKLMKEKETCNLSPTNKEKYGSSSVAFSLQKTSSKNETVASTLKVKDEKPLV